MSAKLSSLAVFCCGAVALVLLGQVAVRGTARADDGGVPFVCPTGCDCVLPANSTVYCVANPTICSVISDPVDCFSYSQYGASSRMAYSPIGTGKKPDGCKSQLSGSNCTEESKECYLMTYCTINQQGNCAVDGTNQGPAQQATFKKKETCAVPGGGS